MPKKLREAKFKVGEKCKVIKNALSPKCVGDIVTILEVCITTSNKYFYKVSSDIILSNGEPLVGYAEEDCLVFYRKTIDLIQEAISLAGDGGCDPFTDEEYKQMNEFLEDFEKGEKILVDKKILENTCKYCEDMAIYDKLLSYGDFYYKIKKLLKENN